MTQNLYLAHHGVKGMKWGVRRFQRMDGSRTSAGKQQMRVFARKNNKSSGAATSKSGKKSSGRKINKKKAIAIGVAAAVGVGATIAATKYVSGARDRAYRAYIKEGQDLANDAFINSIKNSEWRNSGGINNTTNFSRNLYSKAIGDAQAAKKAAWQQHSGSWARTGRARTKQQIATDAKNAKKVYDVLREYPGISMKTAKSMAGLR